MCGGTPIIVNHLFPEMLLCLGRQRSHESRILIGSPNEDARKDGKFNVFLQQ